MSLFINDCLHRKSQIIYKTASRISEFTRVAEYKVNMQKPVVFLHTSNEIKIWGKKVTFTITSNIKYLGINLTNTCKIVGW